MFALVRALLIVGGMALMAFAGSARLALAQPEAPSEATRRVAGHGVLVQAPTIQSHESAPEHGLLGGKPAELVSVELRSVMRLPVGTPGEASYHPVPGRLRERAARWCDVVQCRRLGGVRLLGYATPPPSRA
jgi:hypothetical protein